MNQTLVQKNEQEYLITFTNRFGQEVSPMFPIRESEMAIWVENFLTEGKFIKFKRL